MKHYTVSIALATVAAQDTTQTPSVEGGAVCKNNADCETGFFCKPTDDKEVSKCQPNESCNKRWSQCGGSSYVGSSCCVEGSACKRWNRWYSQCVPSSWARDAEASCTNVSVEGDATYCVSGPVCSGSGESPAGTYCPKKGDVAVGDCISTLPSYVSNNAKCVATQDATCVKIKTGAYGCVFGAASPATTTTPLTTTTSVTTTAPVTTAVPTTTSYPTVEKSCINVSVSGDATYCIKGAICGGEGDACPKRGDLAVADCLSTIPSYVDSSHCYAPIDAVCQKLPSGARGCVFPKKPNGKSSEVAEQSCTNVSVAGDATYCVNGAICGDSGDACPKKGDLAVADCLNTIPSYVDSAHCYAPVDAVCQKLPSGARGCVFGAAAPATTTTPETTAVPITTTVPESTAIPATTTSNGGKQCSTNWSQCNGQNWPHGVCCQDPNYQCNYKNQYLSLCEPKNNGKDAEVAEVAVWQQCGGKNYNGDKTCSTGNKCVYVDDWYSQCRPDATASGLPTWGQCGGKDYGGRTDCRAEDKCQKWNDYYSQCIPK